jgi:long-chain fatty acid transport protein
MSVRVSAQPRKKRNQQDTRTIREGNAMEMKRVALASVAAAMVGFSGAAWAGGFAVPEQSAVYLGTSFAGAAAGGDVSAMFWNPAALVTAPGMQIESVVTFGRQSSNVEAQFPGTSAPLFFDPSLAHTSGNIFPDAVIPAFYASYQVNRDLFIGLGVNSPFGSSTHPQNRNWDGLFSSTSVHLATYDLNPNIAYRILPGLTVGVGAQIQYMSADLRFAAPTTGGLPFAPSSTLILDGQDHWAFGFTAGMHWQPTQSTQIGFGYRSAVNENLRGEARISDPTFVGLSTALTQESIRLPAIATASIRQDVTPTFALLGTVQWTQWSNLQTLNATCQSTSAIGCTGGPGSILASLPFHWHDGWLFSGGVEQKLNEAFLLRAGAAYEKSPVQSADEDKVAILDSDRIWASVGLQYKINRMMTADLAYAHVFFKDSLVSDTAPFPPSFTVVGSTQRSADIISASLKLRFDPPPPPAPKIVK